MQDIYSNFRDQLYKICKNLIKDDQLKSFNQAWNKVTVEPPKDQSHGDFSTNVILICGRLLGLEKLEFFNKLQLQDMPYVKHCAIAGPGFINIFLHDDFWRKQIFSILTKKTDYGKSDIGHGEAMNIEYVSVNPTGPLHIGHARGAVFGDILANLMTFVNYRVTKEYYVNDAGNQIDILADSVYKRYLELTGHGEQQIDGYKGEYLKSAAKNLRQKFGDNLVLDNNSLKSVKSFVISQMMQLIKSDLDKIDINHDVYTSEMEIITSGKVQQAFNFLEKCDLLYEGVLEQPKSDKTKNWKPRKQTLFKATKFGDDVDRPLKKEDGSWAYLAPDMAYHFDKYNRCKAQNAALKDDSQSSVHLINVWGADHKGYVTRITASLQALTNKEAKLDVPICQLVRFMENGQPFKMSKRNDNFILLKDLIEKIGKDAVRFMLILRKNDTQFDFDLTQALEKSKDNPVFYVQYAYARCCSALRRAVEIFPELSLQIDKTKDIFANDINFSQTDTNHYQKLIIDALNLQDDFDKCYQSHEWLLVKIFTNYPRQIKLAAKHREPHRIANYLYRLATQLHISWSLGKSDPNNRFIMENDQEKTFSKLLLLISAQYILKSGLNILGVNSPDQM